MEGYISHSNKFRNFNLKIWEINLIEKYKAEEYYNFCANLINHVQKLWIFYLYFFEKRPKRVLKFVLETEYNKKWNLCR